MFFELTTDFDLSVLARIGDRLGLALDCRQGPMRAAMDLASAELIRWENGRFISASGGDGTWRDISPKTKRRRLKGQAAAAGSKARITTQVVLGQHLPILYDTTTLYAGLFERGAEGHFVEFEADGVREGVAGGTHPNTTLTVGALAEVHDRGLGHVPKRPVMSEPDGSTTTVVVGHLATGVNDAFQQLVAAIAGESQAA